MTHLKIRKCKHSHFCINGSCERRKQPVTIIKPDWLTSTENRFNANDLFLELLRAQKNSACNSKSDTTEKDETCAVGHQERKGESEHVQNVYVDCTAGVLVCTLAICSSIVEVSQGGLWVRFFQCIPVSLVFILMICMYACSHSRATNGLT